jgi:hypothetical protein
MGERRYSFYSFLTSALDWGEWLASRPGLALPPGKGPPVPIGQEAGWSLRAGLDAEARGKILCLCRGSNPGHPVRSQTELFIKFLENSSPFVFIMHGAARSPPPLKYLGRHGK